MATFDVKFRGGSAFKADFGQTQVVETGDYEKLSNKPSINSVEVIGEKISSDYGLQDHMDTATIAEIEAILYID